MRSSLRTNSIIAVARRSSGSSLRARSLAPDSTSSPAFSSHLRRVTRRTTSPTTTKRQIPISSSPSLARPRSSRPTSLSPEPRHPSRPVRPRLTPPRRPSTHPRRLQTRAVPPDPRRSPVSRSLSRPSALATAAPLMVGVVPRLPPRDLRMARRGLVSRSAAHQYPSDPGLEFEVHLFGARESRAILSTLFYYFMKFDS